MDGNFDIRKLENCFDSWKKKTYVRDCEKYERLRSMSERDLIFWYINAKVNYRDQKRRWILTVIWAILILLGSFESCTYIAGQTVGFIGSHPADSEAMVTVIASVTATVVTAIMAIVLFLLFSCTKRLKELYKEMLFAETVLDHGERG